MGELSRAIGVPAKALAKDALFNRFLPGAYAKAALQPVDPRKAVFVAKSGAPDALPDDFALVYRRLADVHGMDVRFVSLGFGEVDPLTYVRNCRAMLEDVATARLVFLNDASDVVSSIDVRPETDIVQLWHACGAFKKFGMSTASKRFGGSREDKRRHPFYENLSLVTVSSPDVEWAYCEAMDISPAEGVVRPTGVSRTDVFFDEGFRAAAREMVEHAIPAAAGKRILLYAPTFRGDSTHAKGPDALDVRALADALSDEWFLVIRHHPFVKHPPAIPDDCAHFACMAPGGLRIDELMCSADALMTDYSSVIFEYALMDRPMLFFAFDLNDYDEWRGFYYGYDELTPGPVLRTTAEVARFVANVDERFDKHALAAFREKFMRSCDGRATERICNLVLGKCDG